MELIKKIVKKLFSTCSVYTVIYNADGEVIYSDDPLVPVVAIMPSIWDTVEADAWSRNYTYWEYTTLCLDTLNIPVPEYMYKAIYAAMTTYRDKEFP